MPHEPPGGYQIFETLTEDAIGGVYKAPDLQFNRLVLLKTGPVTTHLYHEARMVARLQHPNIVQLHAVWKHLGQLWLVMELVEGVTLAQMVADAPCSARAAAGLMEQVASAVQAVREIGRVHGGLTLDSVQVTNDGQAKVALPKAPDDSELAHLDRGSPGYVAPELVGIGLAARPSADIFALGVILYRLVTGRMPFRGETARETLRKILHEEPLRPSRVNRQVPRGMDLICLKSLQKDPKRRYPTAELLAKDLHSFQGDGPPGPFTRFWRRWMPILSGAPPRCAPSCRYALVFPRSEWNGQ
jgi:eukaryotic-like serine/threonine-protein kinase